MVGFIVRCSPTLDVDGLPPSTQTDILAKLLTTGSQSANLFRIVFSGYVARTSFVSSGYVARTSFVSPDISFRALTNRIRRDYY
ncbi:hypothetical protein PGT21_021419 [Puccinia graminis f. sp. tritici]|uniref:Uncharacterized protein n=1 Tax=Puccinia graminis f. sp. tritici TaxID=56615 RepID=A0A5B0S1U2_PUCGR|nr:hypothetical protein PGT21_021419 [Puccinia graminis f. sp. tritici]KAA1131857.1 hypothetical protein PGTUg99_030607 [Puccinia graminis f. sp. tritici]